ncbi:MAG: hypothetical protein ACUBOA_12555 [Candidatus Loosdrechtia sp.]|uniref:hypothetical protein n=1 Tax=Candidatus Loosdrechtia sp. TaxID=3101272 RepID=UPI003A6FE374|nr:MAG: hypothetical protein QY305_11930 [Candidatus Jettenia sp. AMX2]
MLGNGCTFLKTKFTGKKDEYLVDEGNPRSLTIENNPERSGPVPETHSIGVFTGNPSQDETIERMPVQNTQGAGYLSRGATISLGVRDGDEEIALLKKIQRLEDGLEKERKEKDVLKNTYEKKLSDLQTVLARAKEEFFGIKKELEDRNRELLEKIKVLEFELNETGTRAIAAEQELRSVKKELLKTQLSEIRSQQELYKLKIDSLKQD